MMKKKIEPESQPQRNASLQDDLDHNQNIGTSAISATKPRLSFGNAIDKMSGDPMLSAQRHAAVSGAEPPSPRMSRDVENMRVSVRFTILSSCAAVAAAFCLTACGRGPVEPIASPSNPTLTLELFVQGQITPSQGDYIIALNNDTGAFPNFSDVNQGTTGEQPGEATIVEAYGLTPPPFTHWDQAFIYGSNPNGLPNCSLAPPNGFLYCYKAVSQNGGQITIKFFPIILTPNSFTFNPSGNGGSGTGNAIILTLPISCMSIFVGSNSQSCDTVTTSVTQIYVNFITLDTNGVPQDQLACIPGQSFPVDLTFTNTQQIVKPANCTQPPPPSNQNLLITGGFISVNVPGT
jgi:hypothetical protein